MPKHAGAVLAPPVSCDPEADQAFVHAALLETSPAHVVMVGDDVEVDISMALRAGAPAVLVLSGAAKREELDGRWQPTAIVNDVTELPALLAG